MEIHVNRKVIIIAVAIVALIVGATVVLWPSDSSRSSAPTVSGGTRTLTLPSIQSGLVNTNPPEEAAISFAKAFYVVNYTDYEGWLAGLSAVSTSEGYAILNKSIAPVVWPEIEKAKTVTPVEAVDASDGGLVLEGDSKIGGPWQIRSVNIHIDSANLWPTMKSGDFTALVMLAQQAGQWRFVSFMTPEQVEQIQAGSQP